MFNEQHTSSPFQEMFGQSFIKFADIQHLRIIPINSCFFGFTLLFRTIYTGNFILYSTSACIGM